MKCEILNLYEKMDSEPKTSFERMVVCEDDEAFILSSSNLESVEKMLYDLQNQLQASIKYADDIRERISVLFDKLELPGKDSFLAAHRGFSKMVIEEVSSSLDRITLKFHFKIF
jgi:protein regulator of cytokinesis 1